MIRNPSTLVWYSYYTVDIVRQDEKQLPFRWIGYRLREVFEFLEFRLKSLRFNYLSSVSVFGNEFLLSQFLDFGLKSVFFNDMPRVTGLADVLSEFLEMDCPL